MAKAKTQSSPKTGNKVTPTTKPKTHQQARVDAVNKEVNKPAVDKMARKLEEVAKPKARALTEGELQFLHAGTYRADYIRNHLKMGWDATKQEPRPEKAGEGWESIIRLGVENKNLGANAYLSYKTQCQQALEEYKINYSLQGAGAKQLVDLKPKRVSKGGSKGSDNTETKPADKPSASTVETWVSNIVGSLKEHEVEELAYQLVDAMSPINQQAFFKHYQKSA